MQQGRALLAGVMAVLASPALALDLPADTDPIFAEAYTTCLAAIDAGGFLDQSYGWTGHDSGDPDAVAWTVWQRSYSTKDFPGVGGANLSVMVEDYTSRVVGSCSFSIDAPQRDIAPPVLSAAGFLDRVQGQGADWSGLWQNPEGTLFLRGVMSSNAERFLLSVMTLEPKP
jgi:hypothetical protein